MNNSGILKEMVRISNQEAAKDKGRKTALKTMRYRIKVVNMYAMVTLIVCYLAIAVLCLTAPTSMVVFVPVLFLSTVAMAIKATLEFIKFQKLQAYGLYILYAILLGICTLIGFLHYLQ